mgnify:CR=1 FL=1
MSETEPQFKGPAIAVVVPVHNGAAFLQQCLASLAAQTFGDFACFVVDDGSTDESAELAAAWESRDARFVVIHQRQSGVAAARAAGVRAGLNLNARWFAFCDADDCYHKQFLDALYRAAQTTRCQIACCRYDCFTEDIPPESPPPSQTTVFQPPAHLDALLHDHRVDFGLWNKLYAHELITAEIMDNGLAYNEDLVANWQIFSAADGCAYVDFAGPSALELVDRYENLLVVQTFSKSRQLAGARLGLAMGNAKLIADLNRVKFSLNPYNINRLTLKAGQAALEDTAYFDRTRAAIVDTRTWTKQQLEARGFAVLDSRSNFLFASTDRKDGGTLYKKLKENGILVRHFDAPRIANWLRITIGTPEQMQALVETLDKILEE